MKKLLIYKNNKQNDMISNVEKYMNKPKQNNLGKFARM